jgi:hypothetical protein
MSKIFTTLSKAVLFGTLIASVPMKSEAQVSVRDINNYLDRKDKGKNVSLFHRFEVGYGITYGTGTELIYNRTRSSANAAVVTGSTSGQTFSFKGESAYAAVYFPLTYLSSNTALLLNTGLYTNFNVYDLGNTSLDPGVSMTNQGADAVIGLPIGVDIAYGGEVTNNKIDKVTLRGGIGAMPYINYGVMADGTNGYAKFGVKPYVKAELGFFFGVEWKVRGMIVAGSRTIYNYEIGDYNLNNSNNYASYSLKVSPSYVIGFSVFPFSFGWENDKW